MLTLENPVLLVSAHKNTKYVVLK